MVDDDERGNLFDPNLKRFNIGDAHAVLGMDEQDQLTLRLIVSVDLLLAHAGITEEQVVLAYEQRLKGDLKAAAESIRELAGDDS